MPRNTFYIKFKNLSTKCNSISTINTFSGSTAIGEMQVCGNDKYDTLCRLNYIAPTDQTVQTPRCFKADDTLMNDDLDNYLKKCADITGMIADPENTAKCITNKN